MHNAKRLFVASVAVAATSLAGCGGSSDSTASAGPTSTADSGQASAVTPVSADILAAAEKEGTMTLYTNASADVMGGLLTGFEAKYPKIKVKNLNLSDSQAFERYQTEVATGTGTADVVMAADPTAFKDFVSNGNVLDYEDPNVANLPAYAKLAPGVVAVSEDPSIVVFNSSLLPKEKQPTSMKELAALAPTIKGKIGTPDLKKPAPLVATVAYLDRQGEDGWEALEAIGPNAGVEADTANLLQKLLQGTFEVTYNVSGTVRPLITGDAAKVINYAYLTDGTPLVPRGIAITAKAAHPNAAKLFVNYALSVEGQAAGCTTGLSAYRAGVKCGYGLSAIEDIVGKDNVIVGTWDDALDSKRTDIVSRWNAAFGR